MSIRLRIYARVIARRPPRLRRGRGYHTNRQDPRTIAAGKGLAERMTYKVTYERDEKGWWVASVKEVPGCHTQGRTIDQARRRIREALGLYVKNAEKAEFHETVSLSEEARKAIATVKKLREEEHQLRDELSEQTRRAVAVLTKHHHVSVRDAGDLLDLSHQRIHQLANEVLVNSSASKRRRTKPTHSN